MTNRRNFKPDQPGEYEHRHIKFRAVIEADLHNVGRKFELREGVAWLGEAIEQGLKLSDPNDEARIVNGSAELISRPACRCYKDEPEKKL